MKKPICPGSRVRLAFADDNTPEWKYIIGKIFEIDYYSKQDGLEVVWLKDVRTGKLETTDQRDLENFFEILLDSENDDYFADRLKGPPLGDVT